MFYLFNVQAWLEEIIDTCGKKGLDPSKSVFCLTLFSSLDAAYVKFFRNYKEQISSYSGENVHLFTPIIYDNDVVPDNEWQSLRRTFSESGVNLGAGPSVVLFNLKKRDHGSGYDPEYIGAFALPERKAVAPLMRDFVSMCIDKRSTPKYLLSGLSEMLGKPNLINRRVAPTEIRLTAFENPLHAPTVFLSYAHADDNKVLRVSDVTVHTPLVRPLPWQGLWAADC